MYLNWKPFSLYSIQMCSKGCKQELRFWPGSISLLLYMKFAANNYTECKALRNIKRWFQGKNGYIKTLLDIWMGVSSS